jgi:ABC-type tungstate transport system substrate-binding protein
MSVELYLPIILLLLAWIIFFMTFSEAVLLVSVGQYSSSRTNVCLSQLIYMLISKAAICVVEVK